MIILTYIVRRAASELGVTEGWGNKILGEASKSPEMHIYIYIYIKPPTKPKKPKFFIHFGGSELADTTEEKNLLISVQTSMKTHLRAQQWSRKQNRCWDYMERYTDILWKYGINQKIPLLHNLLTPSSQKGYTVKFLKVQKSVTRTDSSMWQLLNEK